MSSHGWVGLFSALFLLAACVPLPSLPPTPVAGLPAGGMDQQAETLANPASEHCAQQGGVLEIRQAAGGETGVCTFDDGSECEEWALLRGECRPGRSPALPDALPAPSADIVARAAMFRAIDMSQSPLLDKLAGWELAVLDKVLEAADLMDAAFWQQVDPQGEGIFRSLAGRTDPAEQAARLLLDANYGRWDRFREFAPFLGEQPRPPGGYVYPPDLTREDLDAYITAHPDQREALLSPFTVVRREGDALVAVPYHEAYAAFVMPAADLLDQAAALSENRSLATYLRLQAEALRTDEYFAANMAWLDLDSNIDVSIGPHETYDDQLVGQKAFYKSNVLIVDRPAAQQLAALMDAVPTLQARLPVPAEFRPDQAGTMTPLELTDDVYRTGQTRAIMEAVAFSLPNDPKVWEAKGAKKVMMGNYLQARRSQVLAPLASAILADPAARQLDAEHYFNFVLLHEVAHTLGPRTVQADGQEKTVTQALGEYYAPIEEGKADIAGMYELPYLLDQGILAGSLESHYVGYLAEALRSIRFGMGSPYGMVRTAAWSFFVEQGALTYDAAGSRYDLDMERMTPAVEQLARVLLTIEGDGDPAAAKAFFERYARVAPELQALLHRADQSVPVEFVPIRQRPSLPSTARLNPAASALPAGWTDYSNREAGFSIGYPPGWIQIQIAQEGTSSLQGVAVEGPEGRVEMYWGSGFGGTCRAWSVIHAAQGQLLACHMVAADGTQQWNADSVPLATTRVGARGFTKDAEPVSAELVLAVLATLTFDRPAVPVATAAMLPGAEVVVDNGDASFWPKGDWYVLKTPQAYGEDCYSALPGLRASGQVRPDLPAGAYEVFARWCGDPYRNQSAQGIVEVHRSAVDPAPRSVAVNYQANAGQWQSLGTYNFGPGAFLSVESVLDGSVVADVFRFVYRSANGAEALPTPMPAEPIVSHNPPTPLQQMTSGDLVARLALTDPFYVSVPMTATEASFDDCQAFPRADCGGTRAGWQATVTRPPISLAYRVSGDYRLVSIEDTSWINPQVLGADYPQQFVYLRGTGAGNDYRVCYYPDNTWRLLRPGSGSKAPSDVMLTADQGAALQGLADKYSTLYLQPPGGGSLVFYGLGPAVAPTDADREELFALAASLAAAPP